MIAHGSLGVQPEGITPVATRTFVASEVRRCNEVVDKTGIERL